MMFISEFIDSLKNNHNTFLIYNNNSFSFSDIHNHFRIWIDRFSQLRIVNKVITVVGEFSPSSIGLLLASIVSNNIFVPIAKESKIISEIIKISESDYHVDLYSGKFEPILNSIRSNKLIIELLHFRNHPGLILFSSGSTGFPKGAIHDFTPLLEKYKNFSELKKINSLAFLLFDHIGGINTVLYNLFSMGILVIPNDREPDYILSLIDKYHLELLPTTPSFLNLILLNKTYERYNLSSLKTISYGTEPMPEGTLLLMTKVFPNTILKQTYGLTELGIMRTKSESSNSLWLKLGDDNHQIDIRDGILWIKSKMSMLGYLNADSPFDNNGWFNTKDRVEVKGEYIKILGRDSELINVGGLKVFPTEVENIILQVKGVLDVMAYGLSNSILGKVVAIKVYTKDEDLNSLKNIIIRKCTDNLEKYKRPVKVEFVNQGFQSERLKKKRI